jgi:hypothetical protein
LITLKHFPDILFSKNICHRPTLHIVSNALPKDPKNYKSFTLMTYLGKVFTGILNNRLASLSDEFGLLSSAQAGFRNAHSTADNIFILHTFAFEDMCYNTNTPTYRNYTFIKNKVKQFRIYWNHKIHSIL